MQTTLLALAIDLILQTWENKKVRHHSARLAIHCQNPVLLSSTITCDESFFFSRGKFIPLHQSLVQLPPSHQPSSVPAAPVPAEGSECLRSHASTDPTIGLIVLRSPTPSVFHGHVRLPQQLQLWCKPGRKMETQLFSGVHLVHTAKRVHVTLALLRTTLLISSHSKQKTC